MKYSRMPLAALLCLSLASCTWDTKPSDSTTTKTPTATPHYKVGEPYKVNNTWYYPKEDYSYDETGIASWYGDAFHNKLTANGEVYNKNELTAAHTTLPLPSLARVTNLENGRSLVVRVNDRGPFIGKRIIDLSERSAELLGFKNQGTAKVRVQVLADESKAIADAMRRYGTPSQYATAQQQKAAEIVEASSSVYGQYSSGNIMHDSVEVVNLAPAVSTPETHKQLLETKPVPYVLEVPVPKTSNIYVQAGSFSSEQNANNLRNKLSGLGNATVSRVLVNGQTFYRVRLGPVATVPQSDALLANVKKAGVSEARTIVD